MAWCGAGDGGFLIPSGLHKGCQTGVWAEKLPEGGPVPKADRAGPPTACDAPLSPCSGPGREAALYGQHPLDPGGGQAPAGEGLACWEAGVAPGLPPQRWGAACHTQAGSWESRDGANVPVRLLRWQPPWPHRGQRQPPPPAGHRTEKPRAFQKVPWALG